MRECLLEAVLLEICLYLDCLRILRVVEMEGGSDDRRKRLGFFPACDELIGGRDETILRAELALWPTCDACHSIGEMRILEP